VVHRPENSNSVRRPVILQLLGCEHSSASKVLELSVFTFFAASDVMFGIGWLSMPIAKCCRRSGRRPPGLLIQATTVERGRTFFARMSLYKTFTAKNPTVRPVPDVQKT